jgi:hypothetical protein
MPLLRPLTLAIALLLLSTYAQAEAALAELILILILMLPAILVKGLYVELARPWIIVALWVAAIVCWLLVRSAGRDVVGGWLERSSSSNGGHFSMTS